MLRTFFFLFLQKNQAWAWLYSIKIHKDEYARREKQKERDLPDIVFSWGIMIFMDFVTFSDSFIIQNNSKMPYE